MERETAWQVQAALAEAEARGVSSPEKVTANVFYEGEMQQVGGLWNSGYEPPPSTDEPSGAGQRINMVTAIRRVLEQELEANPRVLVFGEDVGSEGRRPRGDARTSGEVRARPGVRHVAQRGGHRRPRSRHGARRTDACARDPVPQICRAGDRANPRCGYDALAHATTASQRRWCSACPAASSSVATRGTR